ncbi:hypothetical protein BH09ACT7_BH09ACT7_39620 [soil metagenome]
MRSPRVYRRGLATSVIVFGLGFAVLPSAAAEPGDTVPPAPVDPGTAAPADPAVAAPVTEYWQGGAPDSVPVDTADPASPAVAACSQFAAALDAASTYYGEFADTIDGSVRPAYGDPAVDSTNVTGRTALRQAASLAMSAAGTPGVGPDIADPMRSWSFGATKLLVKMGLRTTGETMNTTATEMNQDAGNAQMACANAGTHA